MLTGIFQTIIMLLALSTFYATDFWMLKKYNRFRPPETVKKDWGYIIMTPVVVGLFPLQPVFLPSLGLYPAAWWGLVVQILGVVMIIAGSIINYCSRIHLAQYYDRYGGVLPDHQVVESGPYAYVRHPIYSSYYLIVAGLVLVNPSAVTLVMLIFICFDFTHHARRDEKALCESLPGYADYMQRTPRFVPRLGKGRAPGRGDKG
ncbi:methyltransferase family protein [Thermodesulfobacteriota bacterium]